MNLFTLYSVEYYSNCNIFRNHLICKTCIIIDHKLIVLNQLPFELVFNLLLFLIVLVL